MPLFIHFALVITLFDSSSTYAFIAKSFVKRIGVPIDLGYDLVVWTLARA